MPVVPVYINPLDLEGFFEPSSDQNKHIYYLIIQALKRFSCLIPRISFAYF